MRIVKVGVLAPTNKGIPLGVQGENRATQVEFDTRPWFREYPYGTVSAVARRDGDPAPYPLALDVADGTAVWQVSDTDTAKAGDGAVELTMTSAGARVRSLTFKTLVTASLTDSPVDDDAWYGWLDKAVVKVDETVQSAQRKMAEVDEEWTGLKADVTAKVDECGKVAAQAAQDAHHAKVDAQATAKALESAEGSVAKAEAAAKRAVNASIAADDRAAEANRSALSAGESADAAAGSAANAATSASEASTSASNAADSASAASGSASSAEQSATDASNAKAAAQTAKAGAEAAKGEAATSASNAATSAENALNSARDAANSVNSINVIAPKTVNVPASSSEQFDIAIGQNAKSEANQSIAIGVSSVASHLSSIALGGFAETSKDYEVAIGTILENGADVTREITHVSTPTGPNSASTKQYTDDNDAKTLTEAKKYTDDNDAKTLFEAKKYTDTNTSNALVGNVSGNLLHVEDAWPGKPLSLTIDGAYKQDGTPSPDSPVPIEVIEHPTLKVNGRNFAEAVRTSPEKNKYSSVLFIEADIKPSESYILSFSVDTAGNSYYLNENLFGFKYFVVKQGRNYIQCETVANISESNGKQFSVDPENKGWIIFKNNDEQVNKIQFSNVQLERGSTASDYVPYNSQSLPITLPAEHPYLATLPDGTHDEIVIDKDGNASLVARVQKVDVSNLPAPSASDALGNGLTRYQYWSVIDPPARNDSASVAPAFKNVIDFEFPQQGMYVSSFSIIVGASADPTDTLKAGGYIYTTLATQVTYYLGKLDIPSLPETISNVWTEAELTTDMSMTYKRDINVAFDNLVQAVVAAAAGE